MILYIASFKEINLAEIIRVLSHEVFHFYHKEMVPERYFSSVLTDSDLIYKRTILMESLADYFSLYYLEENKKYLESYGISKDEIEKCISSRIIEWENYLYENWPYSRALLIMKKDCFRYNDIGRGDLNRLSGQDKFFRLLGVFLFYDEDAFYRDGNDLKQGEYSINRADELKRNIIESYKSLYEVS